MSGQLDPRLFPTPEARAEAAEAIARFRLAMGLAPLIATESPAPPIDDELSPPASGGDTAHNYKRGDRGREPDSAPAEPATAAADPTGGHGGSAGRRRTRPCAAGAPDAGDGRERPAPHSQDTQQERSGTAREASGTRGGRGPVEPVVGGSRARRRGTARRSDPFPCPSPAPSPAVAKVRPGADAIKAQAARNIEAYHRGQAFARAMERAEASGQDSGQSVPSDAELVARAIAEGRVTKVAPGSAMLPGWISGDTYGCVKPRAGGRG